MRIRLYGKILQEWRAEDLNGRERLIQREIAYKEYDSETGELVGTGSEDFSPDRFYKEIATKYAWTWDGKKYNKGDHRWFECQGWYKFRKSERKAVKAYLQNKYKAVELQLR